jgi:hypothetical protein
VKPKLLLHICCGPCSTEVILRLRKDYEVVGFFYNPNIRPEEEHDMRLMEVQRISALWRVLVDARPYDHEQFLDVARGLEEQPEGGSRCLACYRLRLDAAARRAAENGCTHLATTLTIAPMKKAAVINPIRRPTWPGLPGRRLEEAGRVQAQRRAVARPGSIPTELLRLRVFKALNTAAICGGRSARFAARPSHATQSALPCLTSVSYCISSC